MVNSHPDLSPLRILISDQIMAGTISPVPNGTHPSFTSEGVLSNARLLPKANKSHTTSLSGASINNEQVKERHIPNGAPKDAPTTNGAKANGYVPVPLRNGPAYTATRKLRVVTIGAGYSGMIFAHKLRYAFPELEELVANTIFEARHEIGGTWLVNSYPGVQCDVPSHIYAFPFDPYPDWSHFYSTGSEIQEYMVATVKKWNLDRDVQFNTRVTGLYWQERIGQWRVTVEHEGVEREEFANFIISAQGFLNSWKWPDIPGLQDFQGHTVHSALWDHSYDYSNNRIAIVGNGSSGIQILPQLAKLENTDIMSFQRGPTWVVNQLDPGSVLGKPGGGSNPVYTEEEKKTFREDSRAHWEYRKTIIRSVNKAFRMVRIGLPCPKPFVFVLMYIDLPT